MPRESFPTAFFALTLLAALTTGCGSQQTPAGSDRSSRRVPPVALTAPSADAQAPPSATPDDPVAPLRSMRGVTCTTSATGDVHCATEGYDLSGAPNACDEHSSAFGGILAEQGVDLASDVDGLGATRAHVAHGQLVCIQYTADSKSGGDGWSYVVAIPNRLIPRCSEPGVCPEPSGPVVWHGRAPAGACAILGGRYSGACAQGWVKSSDIDAYSMGLGGEHAEH